MEKLLLANPDKKTNSLLSWLLFLLIPVVGFLDYLTGPNITFSLFYLFLVTVIAWLRYTANFFMNFAAFLVVVVWVIVDFTSNRFPFAYVTYTWNFSSRFVVLLIVQKFVSSIRKAHLNVYQISRRDPLTGALNSTTFKELAEHEINLAVRSDKPLTIAFLDVDNFKIINDTFGHSVGDSLLIKIVETINSTVRKSDIVARVGGDEFIILLPETGPDAARVIMGKIEGALSSNYVQDNRPVTFSMGVLTCMEMPPSVDDMIGMADKLMYIVKTDTKNSLAFSSYPGNMINGYCHNKLSPNRVPGSC